MNRTAQPLPENPWMPDPDACIMVYWQGAEDDSFEVALQLIDPALSTGAAPQILVWVVLGPDRPRQAFSLTDESSPDQLLWGRFEWRQPKNEAPQLWLIDAHYPGGATLAAQIA